MNNKKVLVIYTGGTIGMFHDPITNSLKPFDFSNICKRVPEIAQFKFKVDTLSFSPIIDSSEMHPDIWLNLANLIKDNYSKYDGFVILHGTDTMAYTASALSFILQNLNKPVILTGSQLPIDTLRNDGKENLITSIEIAGDYRNDKPIIQEVAICFQDKLYRGNRTTKYNAEQFEAFKSANFPPLAYIGIHINYNLEYLYRSSHDNNKLSITNKMETGIGILRLFPGIDMNDIKFFFSNPRFKAVIIQTYGSGNAPTLNGLTEFIAQKSEEGLIIVNVTQCMAGAVEMEQYETGRTLLNAGVISARDMTLEATVTKLMFLLANYSSKETIINLLQKSIAGELSS